MRLTILVQCPPQAYSDSLNALNFSAAALKRGHSIDKVFFYGDGVYTAGAPTAAAQDDKSVSELWQHFIEENSIDALVCISSATQRGIIDDERFSRTNTNNMTCLPCYRIAGLGELIDAYQQGHRLIQFH